ncbi:MAG: UDP-glucose 4-epimerase [Candidatus Cloacimonadota bacterium]|jgi:UDP-glucose 4-epimerase|nr:UDP-glucose 4-epimerase [Candidatus Cloacimonadota bacterium]
MNILVTGGTGYIGSHTVVELMQAGHRVVIIDNLSNSKQEVLNRISNLTGNKPKFYQEDIRDSAALHKIFQENHIEAVIHFAGLKAVGESVAKPLAYYENNVNGSLVLLQVMTQYNIKDIVFSSSATVYGEPETVPITEDFPLHTTNPYGTSKLMIEQIMRDLYNADSSWNVALLRYFNPVGAHPSGTMGEDPQGIPNNLMPYISQVAVGKRKKLNVFGNDYQTADGTGVRDYIHVVDLARGHLAALQKLQEKPGIVTYNLGTGRGYSVLEVIAAFSQVSGKKIPYQITARRPGDIGECYADASKAAKDLGWKAQYDLLKMCEDSWRWQKNNPEGY